MKTHIFIINGYPKSGKDTFVEFCHDALPPTYLKYNISSVDCVKSAAHALGWNGVKDSKGRKFLSDLKDMSTKLYDGPMQYMINKMAVARTFNHSANLIFFFHIREPEEIARFVKLYPKTITIGVRASFSERHDNTGDKSVENYIYDYYIDNSGTLEDLKQLATHFITEATK